MTPNEVFRTAHEYTNNVLPHGFGRELPHGINQVCRCCKSEDTEELKGATATPWRNFYSTKEWRAYRCNSCGYQFSWYRDKQSND